MADLSSAVLRPVGDTGVMVEFGRRISPALNRRVHALACNLAGQTGLVELTPAYASLLVEYDPLRLSYSEAEALIRERMRVATTVGATAGRVVPVPTVYGGEHGPDLSDVAQRLNLTEEDVVRLHSSRTYRVYMLGFAPGYPYTGQLPEQFALPRRATPRVAIPGGSVVIANRQTGIHPIETPGGWHVIGRTPLRLFDPWRDPPAYFAPGDRARFVPIQGADFEAVEQSPRLKLPASTDATLEVLAPGLHTSVQDLGRVGYARFGVPRSGPMDGFAARAANALVGNDPRAAILEVTFAGPTIRFHRDCVVAVAGADLALQVDGAEVGLWTSLEIRAGSLLRFGRRRSGLRAYLAVAGGIEVPLVLGSAATFARGEFGGVEGRALRAGDTLKIGTAAVEATRLAGRHLPPGHRPLYRPEPEIRVLLGPHHERFLPRGIDTFLSAVYVVAPASDRMGYRLHGPPLACKEPADILSCGMPLGGIQVPGDGQPIVLMSDHQTTGGYPLIASVIQADLPLLAQVAPGDSIRFHAVSVATAREAYVQQFAWLETLVA